MEPVQGPSEPSGPSGPSEPSGPSGPSGLQAFVYNDEEPVAGPSGLQNVGGKGHGRKLSTRYQKKITEYLERFPRLSYESVIELFHHPDYFL